MSDPLNLRQPHTLKDVPNITTDSTVTPAIPDVERDTWGYDPYCDCASCASEREARERREGGKG
jgi:hypothetical protein